MVIILELQHHGGIFTIVLVLRLELVIVQADPHTDEVFANMVLVPQHEVILLM